MMKALFVLFVASVVLFSSTFAGSIESYEESNSSSASSSSSSSYSSSQTKGGKTSSNSNSSANADASAYSSYISRTKAKCCKNERYVKCPTSLCVPFTCDQLGKPIACPRIASGRCPDKPACVCIEGYVRDCNGVCVPKNQCPSCGGDPNAEAGCGFLCSPKCRSNKPVPEDCPCLLNGCVCKPGFLYDESQRKCVEQGQCSACQQNEVYTSCANGGCGKWNCTQYYEPDLCIDPIKCIPGCVCRDKYLRGPNGTCIPQDDCPAALCPKPNEIYDSCPLACPPRQCGIDDRAVLCPAGQPCLPPGCRCKDGFVRNDKGVCVTREECPAVSGPYTCDDSVEQLLSDGNNVFTGIFMHESIKKFPNQSCIMSAFSVFVPLGEFFMYSGGDTRNQIMKVLNLRSDDDVRCVFPRLTKRLQAEQNVILNMASRTFSSDVYPLSDGFIRETNEIFGAGVEPLNFNQPQAAADRINEWVANETNDRIKNIASQDMFSGDTRLVIANVLYFLGNWINQFNPNKTEDRDFHVNKQKTVKIPTMYQESFFNYGENDTLDCKMLQMDYKGGNFSFLIYLPNDIEGLPALIEKLKQPGVFHDSYQAMFYAKVQVHLPKIKAETEFDLIEILESAGVTDLFDASKSYLTGILKKDEPLSVSAAKQKAFCLVDETGTEAAAANIFVVGVTSVMEPPEVHSFDAKQPFAFYILYEQRIPVFSGIFYGNSTP